MHMRGEIKRIERMTSDLKKYSEIAFENSRLVECVIKNIAPPIDCRPAPHIQNEFVALDEDQQKAIEMGLSVK